MTKQAHITSHPGIEVGDKALGLCGKEFKVRVLWSDLPADKPICRPCVDSALAAMTEADQFIEGVRMRFTLVANRVESLTATFDQDLELDRIADMHEAFAVERDAKAAAKAARELAAHSCTCRWEDPFHSTVDPTCPIHGAKEEEE